MSGRLKTRHHASSPGISGGADRPSWASGNSARHPKFTSKCSGGQSFLLLWLSLSVALDSHHAEHQPIVELPGKARNALAPTKGTHNHRTSTILPAKCVPTRLRSRVFYNKLLPGATSAECRR